MFKVSNILFSLPHMTRRKQVTKTKISPARRFRKNQQTVEKKGEL